MTVNDRESAELRFTFFRLYISTVEDHNGCLSLDGLGSMRSWTLWIANINYSTLTHYTHVMQRCIMVHEMVPALIYDLLSLQISSPGVMKRDVPIRLA